MNINEEEDIINTLIDDLSLELCFEMHYAVKTGDMTLDELYGIQPLESNAIATTEVVKGGIQAKKNGSTSSSNSAGIVSCPVCYEIVAGLRFAPHLEKCLNGGKRGGIQAKKSSTTSCNGNNMGIGLPYFSMVKKPDPYPQSLVVRVRFKDGVPKKSQIREGVLLADFQSWKEIEEACKAFDCGMVGSTNGINTIHNGVHDLTDSTETSKMDIACISY